MYSAPVLRAPARGIIPDSLAEYPRRFGERDYYRANVDDDSANEQFREDSQNKHFRDNSQNEQNQTRVKENCISDAELGLNKLKIFRCDRDSCISVYSRDGDVLIAVRDSLFCCPVAVSDYNLPGSSWMNGDCLQLQVPVNCSLASQASLVCDYFNLMSFFQLNTVANVSGYMLDLFFSSFRDISVAGADESIVPCLVNWDDAFANNSIDDAVDFFYSQFDHVISAFVPVQSVVKSSYPNWFSKELISLIKAKKLAHCTFKWTNAYADYLVFSHLRENCKALSAQCWSAYVRKTEAALSSDAKIFWSFVKNARTSEHRSARICHDDVFLESDAAIANCFADHFESVYSRITDHDDHFSIQRCLDISGFNISEVEVFNTVNSLSLNCGAGLDGIPPSFIKSCAFIMSHILCLLFNKSLNDGIFPAVWKQCLVTPTFKDGDQSRVTNYRPICEQSVILKIFDCIVARKLSSLCKNVIVEEQHGFMSGQSTVTNLLIYSDFLTSSIELGYQVDAVYTDFSKAFDQIDHLILMRKLELFERRLLSLVTVYQDLLLLRLASRRALI
ncbi:hypothetical protein DMN91_011468 [Ooceraea biroi]|uniref:Reverse transcriptase domain-containing protein n=1 Tax=Ooceraea biroi TaxID=2015173 RepID=A0A3L8D6P2_OOCBI|nr:uncharacterized protein LOC113563022 [Ooceraea biroi]RLU15713.1 hypothetical protein DMN91_011468 [Ooceraea biroi]